MIKLTDILTEAITPKFEPVKLDYKLTALAPSIDAETMKTHYNKHYKGYIDKLNEAIKKENIPVVMGEGMAGIRTILSSVSQYSDAIRNNGGGFYNHTLYFNNMMPKGGKPSGPIEEAINKSFGSYDKFKEAVHQAASDRFGSGWVWLMLNNQQLYLTTTPNQDNPYMDVVTGTPGKIIMALDVWEHSYYLKYKNDRSKYVDAFLKVLCFDTLNERYERHMEE